MPGKIKIDPDELHRLYHEEGLSLAKVANRFDCSMMTIYNRMVEHGFPVGPPIKTKNPSKLIARIAANPNEFHRVTTTDSSASFAITDVKVNTSNEQGRPGGKTTDAGKGVCRWTMPIVDGAGCLSLSNLRKRQPSL